METFGDRLRRLREQAGITQQAVADILGLTASSVGQWEANRTVPTIDKVTPLADALQVSCDELLFGVRW